jgi:hypothetical protein
LNIILFKRSAIMPARRKKRIVAKRSVKIINRHTVGLILIFLLLTALLIVVSLSKAKYWDGSTKLHMVMPTDGGNIQFTIFDPHEKEIVNILIPGNTQVEVARQLGVWKLGSVWELGRQEKMDGKLLAATVMREFNFPVYVWADSSAEKLSETNIFLLARFILDPFKSNLNFADKLKLGVFALQVQHYNNIAIDLRNTGYLKKAVLTDGEEGYVVAGKLPKQLVAYLAYPEVSKHAPSLEIINKTGNVNVAGKAGEVVEVMGAKVAAINNENEEDIDCSVSGNNAEIVKIYGLVFNCEIDEASSTSNLDLQLMLGKRFFQRY